MKKTAENDFDKAVECIVKSDFNKNLNKCLDIVKELDKKDKEIERLRAELKLEEDNRKYLNEQIERLHSIIKEVREYIEMHTPSDIGICGNKTKRYYTLGEDSVDHILEILDKGSDKE